MNDNLFDKVMKVASNINKMSGGGPVDKWGRPPGDKWYGFNPDTKKWTVGQTSTMTPSLKKQLPIDRTKSETAQMVSFAARQAIPDINNKPSRDIAIKKDNEKQQAFKKEQWKVYEKLPVSEKISDRLAAFVNDPAGMTSRALLGEQAYIPGMAQGLHNYEEPEVRNRYLKELGYTPGEFDAYDIQSMVNPGSIATSFTENVRKGNTGTAFVEGALSALPFIPKNLITAPLKKAANIVTQIPKTALRTTQHALRPIATKVLDIKLNSALSKLRKGVKLTNDERYTLQSMDLAGAMSETDKKLFDRRNGSILLYDDKPKFVTKVSGENVDYLDDITAFGGKYDPLRKSVVLKDAKLISDGEYTDQFNKNISRANEIINKNNKSGVKYSIVGMRPGTNGESGTEIIFKTHAQTVNGKKIPEGFNVWGVDLQPGKWKGTVQDIPSQAYYKAIPGINMSNTTQSVFADGVAINGTGTYKSINQFLKEFDLGRVKPGFNSQTKSAKTVWERALKSGKASGHYNNPGTIHGAFYKNGGDIADLHKKVMSVFNNINK